MEKARQETGKTSLPFLVPWIDGEYETTKLLTASEFMAGGCFGLIYQGEQWELGSIWEILRNIWKAAYREKCLDTKDVSNEPRAMSRLP